MIYNTDTENTGGQVSYLGKRSKLASPWHLCARCDTRTHIDAMTWQRGLLLCPKCLDKHPLLGEREAEIANIISQPTDELRPDPKLTEPSSTDSDGDENIIF